MLQNNPHADAWRQTHLGQLLGHALRQFDQRVRTLMVQDAAVPLALSNLAERDKVSAAHLHITRHLSPQGDRLTDLADRAGMSKQAMADLIDQCEAWGLVERRPDPLDRRAKRVCYTASGLQWYQGFARATAQARPNLPPPWARKWPPWCALPWRCTGPMRGGWPKNVFTF